DPRLILARTFQRGEALFRVAYSDDAVLEQVGDTAPREKKLTSPDAILRAVDKAIEKRLAEGFTEITSPLPADVDPVACFDDAALAELHALRRVPGPARGVDLDLAWGIIQSACAELASYLDEAPAGAEPEAQEDVDAAVRWLRNAAPLPLPSTSAAAVAAFLLAAHRSSTALESLVDVVVGGGDVARATEVLVGYLERCERWVVLPVDDDAARQQPGGDFAAGPAPFRVLRAHLARASESDYQRARRIAEAARQSGYRDLRVALAYSFAEVPEWAHEDARAIRGKMMSTFAVERWLLTAATDDEVLYWLAHDLVPVDVLWRGRTAATAEALRRMPGKRWSMGLDALAVIATLTAEPAFDVPLTMIAATGDAALKGLEMLLDRGVHSQDGRLPHELAAQRAIFRALSCLPTDAGFDRAIPWARSRADGRRGSSDPLTTLHVLAKKAPRRALRALARDRANRSALPAWSSYPLLDRLERDLAARVEGAVTTTDHDVARSSAGEPATGLGAVLLDAAARAIVEALEKASPEELEDAAALVSWDQLMGIAEQNGEAFLDVLERRFNRTWTGARLTADVYSANNPQFQACAVAKFLRKNDHEEAFTYALECLGSSAMLRELDDSLEAHWGRAKPPEERARRASRIADAADQGGEAEYAERWRERASTGDKASRRR
ncbi:MAG: hypothetical protein ACMG6S_09685, partial [Byssovorax sp.]